MPHPAADQPHASTLFVPGDSQRMIDKAANNSSVAVELEWNGWRLLFPGDAEEKSWEMMDRNDLLRPVHFLKISHHGSANGSPERQIDKVLPEETPADGRPRFAVVRFRKHIEEHAQKIVDVDVAKRRDDKTRLHTRSGRDKKPLHRSIPGIEPVSARPLAVLLPIVFHAFSRRDSPSILDEADDR